MRENWDIDIENKERGVANNDTYMQGGTGGGRGRRVEPIQSRFETAASSYADRSTANMSELQQLIFRPLQFLSLSLSVYVLMAVAGFLGLERGFSP